jgi:multisubunit Na+/H+ antiporter MnhB subunit
MRTRTQRAGSTLVLRLAACLAVTGIVCIAASLLIAYLIADHSSSDSSPSSLTAIGLGGLGFLFVLVGVLLVIGNGLERLWRRVRAPSGGTPGRS